MSSVKSWTDPDMIHTSRLKKLTGVHEHLAAQMIQLLVN